MTKNSTTNDDLADALAALGQMFSVLTAQIDKLQMQFEKFQKEFEKLRFDFGQRITALENNQRETNARLDNIEGGITAIRADIRELYGLVSA